MLIVLVISGVLNAAYFFPIVQRAFFRRGRGLKEHKEASLFMVIPLVITASISLFLGIFPDALLRFFSLAQKVAVSIFGGGGL